MIQTVEVAGPSSNFLILIPETFLPALSLLCPHPLLKYILINFFKKKLLHISSYDHFFINIGFIFSDLFFFSFFLGFPVPLSPSPFLILLSLVLSLLMLFHSLLLLRLNSCNNQGFILSLISPVARTGYQRYRYDITSLST